MDDNRIGEFIQCMRKEKGMTQKDLADQIAVSDKTISKWENGNSVPDTEILTSLCQSLDISVNELLSGEKLPVENYPVKAEENMIHLLKENEDTRKSSKLQLAVGMVLGILALILLLGITGGASLHALIWFLDLPTLIGITLICAAVVLCSGVKGKKEVFRIIHKSVIPAGILMALTAVIIILAQLDDIAYLGPNLAVACLSLTYAVLVYLILIPVNKRLER